MRLSRQPKIASSAAHARGRETIFDRFLEAWEESWLAEFSGFTPAPGFPPADLAESESEYLVLVEIAGVAEEDIVVQGFSGHLIVSGLRRREAEFGGKECLRQERRYGAFRRFIPLPYGARVRVDRLDSHYSNGVLRIRVPKAESGTR